MKRSVLVVTIALVSMALVVPEPAYGGLGKAFAKAAAARLTEPSICPSEKR